MRLLKIVKQRVFRLKAKNGCQTLAKVRREGWNYFFWINHFTLTESRPACALRV